MGKTGWMLCGVFASSAFKDFALPLSAPPRETP